MSVSIIIPVRDSRQYLNKCISSIISQTYTDLEILPVFSRDYPQDAVDRCGAADPRIRCIRAFGTSEKDLMRTVEWTASEAEGEYVCFVDSDDRIVPGFVEYMTGMMKDTGCSMGSSGYRVFHWGEDEEFLYTEDDFETEVISSDEFLKREFLRRDRSYRLYAGKIFEKQILVGSTMEYGRIFSDDTELYKRVVKAGTIAVTHLPLYFFLVRSEGIKRNMQDDTDYRTAFEGALARRERLRGHEDKVIVHRVRELCLLELLTCYKKLEEKKLLDKDLKKELMSKYSKGLEVLKKARGSGERDTVNYSNLKLFPGSFKLCEDDYLKDRPE